MVSSEEIKEIATTVAQTMLEAQQQVKDVQDTGETFKQLGKSAWVTFLSGWKGKAIIIVMGFAVCYGLWSVTAPYWTPYARSLIGSQPVGEAQGFFGQVISGFQSDFAGFTRNLKTNWYEALKSVAPYVASAFFSFLFYLRGIHTTKEILTAAGSKVKGAVQQKTKSKAEKKLEESVSRLETERGALSDLNVEKKNKIDSLEDQVKTERAAREQVEKELARVTDEYNELREHPGVRTIIGAK